ncbi:hypothetical protein ACHHYP_07019 [Achlya hypogyna]|uniref:Transmembrane protein n=1 Tax=Achlya hypogyna TaxID=1202772 RepID=A0A1V9YR28_ACHHY|nr:hypothetical protein ACHHYP_07019 [Achlya hypogyna]
MYSRDTLYQGGGIVYAVVSVALSWYALQLLSPYLSNDCFWPSFSSTALVLIQSFNDRLTLTGTNHSFDLVDPSLAQWRSTQVVSNMIGPVYARKVLFKDLSSPSMAIVSLRTLDVARLPYLMTGYCWADLGRLWSLAHTTLRASRCSQHYTSNGAVYLEAILRNVAFLTWMQYVGAQFNTTIAEPIATLANGRSWLDGLYSHSWESLETELVLWEAVGIRQFLLQYANRVQTGITETIAVDNALGIVHALTLKALPTVARGTFWTTSYLFAGLQTDWNALTANQSLVRNASTFFGATNPLQLEVYNVGAPISVLNKALHDQLGELASIDLFWIPVPQSLIATVRGFHTAVATALQQSSTLDKDLQAILSMPLHPTPRRWQCANCTFYGGNPMCTFGAPMSFVQEAFAFDDACGAETQLTVQPTPLASLFAALHGHPPTPASCALLVDVEVDTCLVIASATAMATRNLVVPTTTTLSHNLESLSLMQFVAFAGSAPQLDTVDIITDDPTFGFFGAVMLYEWVTATREAVAFEGDVATMRLLSSAAAPVESPIDVLSTSLSTYLWRCAALTSVGLVILLILLLGLVVAYHPKVAAPSVAVPLLQSSD